VRNSAWIRHLKLLAVASNLALLPGFDETNASRRRSLARPVHWIDPSEGCRFVDVTIFGRFEQQGAPGAFAIVSGFMGKLPRPASVFPCRNGATHRRSLAPLNNYLDLFAEYRGLLA
jgi:hypothetical protein